MSAVHKPRAICEVYCGPAIAISVKEFRANPHKFSETSDPRMLSPSYVPDPFIYSQVSGYRSLAVDKLIRRPPVTNELLESISGYVQDQFEGRIASFWMQALLVYKTGLQFQFCNTADDQMGNSGSKSLVPKETTPGQYAAAHIATLPSMRVLSTDPKKLIAFGQGSFFHTHANATVWLPVVVNKTDTELDMHARIPNSAHSFRFISTQLLNMLASGDCDPKKGLQSFLQYALGYISGMQKTQTEQKGIVLRNYHSVAAAYFKKMDESDYIISALSGQLKSKLQGEELYMHVQSQMHTYFIDCMRKLQQPTIEDPTLSTQLSSALNPSRFKTFLENYYHQIKQMTNSPFSRDSKTVAKYAKFSLTVHNVRVVSLRYLMAFKDEKELSVHLQYALKIKKVETLAKLNLPPSLLVLHGEVLKSLQSKCKNPVHMSEIIVLVLKEMANNPTIEFGN